MAKIWEASLFSIRAGQPLGMKMRRIWGIWETRSATKPQPVAEPLCEPASTISRYIGTGLSRNMMGEKIYSAEYEFLKVGKVGQRKWEIRGTAGFLLS